MFSCDTMSSFLGETEAGKQRWDRTIIQFRKAVASAYREMDAVQLAEGGFRGAGGEIPHKEQMERSFGRRFDHVRAHVGGDAADANTQLGAHAYAMGDRIAFKRANPAPSLVAHELTHVIQQTEGPARSASGGAGNGVDTSGEAQAEAVEAAVAAGRPASSVLGLSGGGTGGGVARKAVQLAEDDEEEKEEAPEPTPEPEAKDEDDAAGADAAPAPDGASPAPEGDKEDAAGAGAGAGDGEKKEAGAGETGPEAAPEEEAKEPEAGAGENRGEEKKSAQEERNEAAKRSIGELTIYDVDGKRLATKGEVGKNYSMRLVDDSVAFKKSFSIATPSPWGKFLKGFGALDIDFDAHLKARLDGPISAGGGFWISGVPEILSMSMSSDVKLRAGLILDALIQEFGGGVGGALTISTPGPSIIHPNSAMTLHLDEKEQGVLHASDWYGTLDFNLPLHFSKAQLFLWYSTSGWFGDDYQEWPLDVGDLGWIEMQHLLLNVKGDKSTLTSVNGITAKTLQWLNATANLIDGFRKGGPSGAAKAAAAEAKKVALD